MLAKLEGCLPSHKVGKDFEELRSSHPAAPAWVGPSWPRASWADKQGARPV